LAWQLCALLTVSTRTCVTSDLIAIENLPNSCGHEVRKRRLDLVQLRAREVVPLTRSVTHGRVYLSIDCGLQNNQVLAAKPLSVQIAPNGVQATFA
jgi:hypothetical protein